MVQEFLSRKPKQIQSITNSTQARIYAFPKNIIDLLPFLGMRLYYPQLSDRFVSKLEGPNPSRLAKVFVANYIVKRFILRRTWN